MKDHDTCDMKEGIHFKHKVCQVWVLTFMVAGIFLLQVQAQSTWNITRIDLPDLYTARSANDIIQDHAGVIWIAANTGLYWNDGVECTLFNNAVLQPTNTGKVYRLVEDDMGRMWVLGEKGLIVLDKQRKGSVAPGNLGLPDSILRAPNMNICKGEEQSIFILSGSTIYLWKNNQLGVWARYSRPAIQTDERSVLLYSRKQDQLYWYLPDQIDISNRILVYQKDGKIIDLWKAMHPKVEKTRLTQPVFKFTLVDAIADSVCVFSCFEPQNVTIVDFPSDDSYCHIQNLTPQLPGGLLLQDIYSEYINKFNPSLNIKNIGRVFIFKISENVIVLSSLEVIILVQVTHKSFQHFKSTLGYRVRAIQKDAFGHISVGSDDGSKYLDQNTGGIQSNGQIYSYVWNIVKTRPSNDYFVLGGEDDINTLYFIESSSTGVHLVKTLADRKKGSEKCFNICMAMDKDRNGFWHFGNEHHLSFYNLKTGQDHKFSPAIKVREERAMIAVKDGIWLAGHNGLVFFSNLDFNNYTLKENDIAIPQQIKKLSINALYLDGDRNLWIGTNADGLFRYETQYGNFTRFTKADGLPENSIYSILAEPNGKTLWLGTGGGLCRFDLKLLWFDNYYTEDGLSNNEFNTGSTFLDSDGTMYMGGQNGINYFHPDSLQRRNQQLNQFLKISLKKTGNWDTTEEMILEPEATIQVAPTVKFIEISFRAADYFHTSQLVYRYRISGIVDQWIYHNNSDKAIFAMFPPGIHTMEVQTRSYRGMWLPSVYYTLNILPPWYATWWFRVLLLFSVIAVLYGTYVLRIRFLRREFSLRSQISHDLHDNLGTRIFLLRSLSHQIANPLLPEKEKHAGLEKLEATAQDTFNTIRNFIWAFDPKKDEVSHLFERMDDFAENYISPLVDECLIDNPTVPTGYKISPHCKHNLIQIYQEVLTNMVKHTHCKAIHIQMNIINRDIIITITNSHSGNRKLKETGHITDHHGIESIQNRLKEINAQLRWDDMHVNKQIATLTTPI